jgi:hypothetical protein
VPSCADAGVVPVCDDDAGPPPGLEVLFTQPEPTLPCDIVTYETSPALVVDSSSAYWMTPFAACGDNSGFDVPIPQVSSVIMRTSLCGRGSRVAASPFSAQPGSQFAVGPTALYEIGDGGTIVQASLGGGCSTSFVTGYFPVSLTLDATNLYWTDMEAETVMKLPLSGGTPTPLSPPLGNTLFGLAVDDAGAYTQLWTVALERLPLGGGPATPLVQTPYPVGVEHIVAVGGNVYWSSWDESSTAASHALSTVPETGGTPIVLSNDPAYGFATDGDSVYWAVSTCGTDTTGCPGALKKVSGGGTPTTLTTGWTYNGPAAVAVDATSVYWTSGNTLMRFTPR